METISSMLFTFKKSMESKGFDHYSSFFLLTSSRTISAAVRSLHTTELYDISAHHYVVRTNVLYFDPTGQQSIPFAYGITLIILFVLPTLLLCVYPFKCIRVPIEYCLSIKSQNALKAFMDTFHGHCKDGTDGARDFRDVSGLNILYYLLKLLFKYCGIQH